MFRLVTTLSPGRAIVKIRLNSDCDPELPVTAGFAAFERGQSFFEHAYGGCFAAPVDEIRELVETVS